VKDGFAIIVFLIVFAVFVFYFPNALGHADNSIEANPLQTPAHIVPEWYLLPFYAILRAITFDIGPISAKLIGVMLMFGSILILFVLPWLDTSKVRSMRYRPTAQKAFIIFVFACVGLGFCGANNPDDLVVKFRDDQLVVVSTDTNNQPERRYFDSYEDAQDYRASKGSIPTSLEVSSDGLKWVTVAQVLSAYYFIYFLFILPLLGVFEKPKPRPASIAESVRRKHVSKSAPVGAAPAPQAAE
jgi:ubiquinol-cytochrome c reductase cytochrome b subunit